VKYNVHLFPSFRVLVENVEAESQEAAIEAAQDVDWHPYPMVYSEGMIGFLVDEVGDQTFEHSQFYMADGETPAPPVTELDMYRLLQDSLSLYREHQPRGMDWANFRRRVETALGVKDAHNV